MKRIAGLLGCSVLACAPGCCCDEGSARLVRVDVASDLSVDLPEVAFDGTVHELPADAFYLAFRTGDPAASRLRTVPMLELVRQADESPVLIDRFLATNDGGCAKAEIYDPKDAGLTVGEMYWLVHRESASPGDLADTGAGDGSSADLITVFQGEPALLASVVVVEPLAQGGQGGGGAGGAGGEGSGGGGSGGGGSGGAGAGGIGSGAAGSGASGGVGRGGSGGVAGGGGTGG